MNEENERRQSDVRAILELLAARDDGDPAADGFDARKVARIRKALRNGTLKVDAGAVADALLARARESGRGRK